MQSSNQRGPRTETGNISVPAGPQCHTDPQGESPEYDQPGADLQLERPLQEGWALFSRLCMRLVIMPALLTSRGAEEMSR